MNRNTKTKEYIRSIYQHPLFYIVVFIAVYLLAHPILPMSDDWYYSTAPNPDFQLADLLPSASFWRPLDVLFGAFLGKFPFLFPMLNKIAVILAHIINAILLGGITKNFGIKKEVCSFAVCFFLFSSATWAVTLSPDALNQAYSNLFGILALYVYLKKGGYLYLILCFIALLEKESGISWFFVIPLFNAFLNGKTLKGFIKNKDLFLQFTKQVVFAFLMIIFYFVIRFALYGDVVLGDNTGTYKISLFSLSTIKNAVLLFASAATGVDSIALMGNDKSFLLVTLTGTLSLVFVLTWVVCVWSLIKAKTQLFPFACLILCGLGLAFPLTILGGAGEMHAYPVLFAMAIIYAFCIGNAKFNTKKLLFPIICLFLAFGISSAHKIISIYEYSSRTQQLTQSIRKVYEEPDGQHLFVVVDDWKGYSIFEQSAAHGTYYGLSMRPHFDWKELNHKKYLSMSEEDADNYIKANYGKYKHIFVIRGETAEKVK